MVHRIMDVLEGFDQSYTRRLRRPLRVSLDAGTIQPQEKFTG